MSIYPQRAMHYNLRNENSFEPTNVSTVCHGIEMLSYRSPKTWTLVTDSIKLSKTLTEFKAKIKKWERIGCTCRLCNIYVFNPRLI